MSNCKNGIWFCDENARCLIETETLKEINSAGYLFFLLNLTSKVFIIIIKSLSWTAKNYSKFWGKKVDYGFKNKLFTKLSSNKQKQMIQQLNDPKSVQQTHGFRNSI